MWSNAESIEAQDLRDLLKSATKADHERLDRAVSELDLCSRIGMARYLQMHFRALSEIEARLERSSLSLAPALDEIRRDLAELSIVANTRTVTHQPGLCPLGVAYVVGGASLGTRMLRRRWQWSPLPDVKAAGRFISGSTLAEIWRDFLSGRIASPKPLSSSLFSATAVFQIYQLALARVLQEDA